jgi:hypothetical protein
MHVAIIACSERDLTPGNLDITWTRPGGRVVSSLFFAGNRRAFWNAYY